MTMITTAIVFDHRGRTKRGAEGPLEVRLTIDRKPYYINTGVRVRAREWEFDKVVKRPDSSALNERLGILLDQIMKDVNYAIKNKQPIDVVQIRKNAWSTSNNETVIDWLSDEIKRLDIKDGTRKHYNSLVNRLKEFGEIKDWSDLTVEKIYKLDAWLRDLPGVASDKMSGGGVYNYHKCLRMLIGRAERSGIITVNPYHRLRGEFSKGDRENTEYLTEEEMAKIVSLAPAKGTLMERARDLFVFQMYTGLSYSDAQAFDISAYKKIDGKWRIVGSRIKTGQPFVNQLLPPVVEVLEKYGMKVPTIENHVYNRGLRTIGTAAGIPYRMHSHLARHTFATFMLRNGVKIENLAKMLGHANIKTTQRYAKVLAESVHEEFDMIEEKLNQKAAR